ncbi:DUF5818 domain-containing protein [Rhizorhapis sp. SPR117]|uniref:DUF5818 domain-containing protein n=1 Tax=Rhizorhapis sp. SPR117 TaxID=2912611 RepID=UPI001F1BBA6E|nr:DUF5818 domain-containing protein [Rhizorhapis sp. SPR117]
MTNGPYRRLTGILRSNGRSSVLETDDGEIVRLATSDDHTVHDGTRVIVEGRMSGPDLLKLVWIGSATV